MNRCVHLGTLKLTEEHEPVSSSSKHYVAVTILMMLWTIDQAPVPILLSSSPSTCHGPVVLSLASRLLARSSLISLASAGLWIWSVTLTSGGAVGFETGRLHARSLASTASHIHVNANFINLIPWSWTLELFQFHRAKRGPKLHRFVHILWDEWCGAVVPF